VFTHAIEGASEITMQEKTAREMLFKDDSERGRLTVKMVHHPKKVPPTNARIFTYGQEAFPKGPEALTKRYEGFPEIRNFSEHRRSFPERITPGVPETIRR